MPFCFSVSKPKEANVDTGVELRFADEQFFNGEYRDSIVSADEILLAINSLPDDYAKAFSLYSDGYKYHEIAEHLNIALGTVKSHIH